MAELKCAVENCLYNKSESWWEANGPAVRMRPAVKAFQRAERTGLPARLSIPARPSALTARRSTACTTAIISAWQITWISEDAAPATAEKPPAVPLQRNKGSVAGRGHRVVEAEGTEIPDFCSFF